MKTILKNVIAAGGYRLADIQHKIKKLYILGDLTENEADQLLTLAQDGASTDAERPGTLALIQTLSDKLTDLEGRVRSLENGGDTEPTGHEVWTPWDGISDNYQPGIIVTHKGKTWISTYEGQNVWEPGTVDDRFWVEYTDILYEEV